MRLQKKRLKKWQNCHTSHWQHSLMPNRITTPHGVIILLVSHYWLLRYASVYTKHSVSGFQDF